MMPRKGVSPQSFRRNADRLIPDLQKAEAELLQQAMLLAQQLSSGPYSSHQLRRMGSPYRRGGTPPADPAIINRQSGRFLRSWKVQAAGKLEERLVNMAPYSQSLFGGTARMIPRPAMERLKALLRGAAIKRLAGALANTLNRR
jgi:hypothetical protein